MTGVYYFPRREILFRDNPALRVRLSDINATARVNLVSETRRSLWDPSDVRVQFYGWAPVDAKSAAKLRSIISGLTPYVLGPCVLSAVLNDRDAPIYIGPSDFRTVVEGMHAATKIIGCNLGALRSCDALECVRTLSRRLDVDDLAAAAHEIQERIAELLSEAQIETPPG